MTPPGSPQPSAGAASTRAPARGWNGPGTGSPRDPRAGGAGAGAGATLPCGELEGRDCRSLRTGSALGGPGRVEAARGFSVLPRDNGSEVKGERQAGRKEKVTHAADSWAVGVGFLRDFHSRADAVLSNLD